MLIIAGTMMVSAFLIFGHFGRVDLALPVCICTGAIMCAVIMRWDLRKRSWFWATVVLVFLLHIPLILMVPFPHMTGNRITLLPFGFADYLIFAGAVRFVEKFMVKASSGE